MAYDALNLVISGSWYVALTSAKAFIQDQGTFMMKFMAMLLAAKAKVVAHNVVALFVVLINDIASIVVQCNHNNHAKNKDILKVLSYNLYVL